MGGKTHILGSQMTWGGNFFGRGGGKARNVPTINQTYLKPTFNTTESHTDNGGKIRLCIEKLKGLTRKKSRG